MLSSWEPLQPGVVKLGFDPEHSGCGSLFLIPVRPHPTMASSGSLLDASLPALAGKRSLTESRAQRWRSINLALGWVVPLTGQLALCTSLKLSGPQGHIFI